MEEVITICPFFCFFIKGRHALVAKNTLTTYYEKMIQDNTVNLYEQ